MSTGKKFIGRTSITRREAGRRSSRQQRDARLQIMFSLPWACETLFSTSQIRVFSLSEPDWALGSLSQWAQPGPCAAQLVGVDGIQPSQDPRKRRGNVLTGGIYAPCQSGDAFQWQSKEYLQHSQAATFILAALPLLSRAMALLGSFSLCAAQISSVAPTELRVLFCPWQPRLQTSPVAPFSFSHSQAATAFWDPSRMDEGLSWFRFHFCIIFSPLGAGA